MSERQDRSVGDRTKRLDFHPRERRARYRFSPDKMPQVRIFAHGDAQRHRLGVNLHLIPGNMARCPFHSYHRDGAMRVDGNYGSTHGHEPNSCGEWREQPDFSEPLLDLKDAARRWNHREDDDYYSQTGKLFRLMIPSRKEALFVKTTRAIGGAPREVQLRPIGNCLEADPEYGEGSRSHLAFPSAKTRSRAARPESRAPGGPDRDDRPGLPSPVKHGVLGPARRVTTMSRCPALSNGLT